MMGRTLAIPIYKALLCFVIGMAKVFPIIDVQVNEKSCRLRMGTYRDGVKRRGDKIGMGV